MIRAIIAALALTLAACPSRAGEAAIDPLEVIVGFWEVDPEAMRADPRFKATLESEGALAGIDESDGMLFEILSDNRMRLHRGEITEQPFTPTVLPRGKVRIDLADGTHWTLHLLTNDALVQSFEDLPYEILWTRSWSPLVGDWRVAIVPLQDEPWYRDLDSDARADLKPVTDALRVTVERGGAFTAHFDDADHRGRVRLASTTPPGVALTDEDSGATLAHFVRRDDGHASLYLDSGTWPLERRSPPSQMVLGDWRFDVECAKRMDWLKAAVPEGQTADEYIRENVQLDKVVQITPEYWNRLPYAVTDERADQMAVFANGRFVFWVRVIDEDHFLQMATLGREFPFVRVKEQGEPNE